MHEPLHRLRNSGGHTPVYLAELTCHYQGDLSGSLGVYIRPIKSDQYARDHGRPAPVVVDPKKHRPPVWTTRVLRRDTLLPGSEDFKARLHSPEYGFEIAHAFPQDNWMKIKGKAAIILDPEQYSAVAFKREDGVQFAVLMSYDQSNKLYESYGYDSWEAGTGRWKIIVYDSAAGTFTEQGLRILEFPLKNEEPRAERLGPYLAGCQDKTHEELPTKQIVVAEMKRETIMGERMLVLDINIYEKNTGLHLLSGISSAPKPSHGGLQEAMPQMLQGEMHTQ